MKCSFVADEAFGPAVASCRRSFDFTLYFEETIFSIIPSTIFILLAITQLSGLWRRPSQVRRGFLYHLKLLVSILYASLQFSVLVEYCTLGRARTRASIPSTALTFLAAIFVSISSLIEHTKSQAPSILLSVYLLVTILLDTVRIRTLWQIGEVNAIFATFVAGFTVKLALLVTESWSKMSYLIDGSQDLASEELAGFLSRSLFLWINPLLMNGFRNWLTPPDLGPIDSKLSSGRLADRFSAITYTEHDLARKYKLILATIKSIGWSAAGPVVPRLFLTGFTFAQPFLVTSILDYLQNSQTRPKNDGYGLIGACVLVYVGIAITSGWYWQQTNRLVTMIRGVLVSSIFSKTLKLRPDSDSESKAMTLMIADVQGIVGSLTHLNELWASIIETALATWLLERQVGLACLSMIGLVIVCTGFTLKISKMSGPRQQAWFAAMQVRLKPTSKMLSSFKAVKMLGADERVRGLITSLRNKEIMTARPFRHTLVQKVTLSYVALTISPVLVFAVFIGISRSDGNELNISRLFTSLVLISLLASPLVYLFQVLPSIGAAIGCFERIQTYLDTEERLDPRQIEANYRSNPTSEGSSDEKSGQIVGIGEKEVSERITHVMLSINGASFAWNETSRPVLKNVNISINRGEHVAIIGQVGSGKSLLLNAILGEVAQSEGSLIISTSEVAYCSQSPWLENRTGKEILSRHEHEDEAWRKSVIWACALDDLEILKVYGEGSIGTGGAGLSGGQKQRLALARAVYSRKAILVLDDPFSALDKTTRSLILVRLFGARGLLRRLGTTVIYTTHGDQFQGSADRVIEIDNEGSMSEKAMLSGARQITFGDPDEIESSEIQHKMPEKSENVAPPSTTSRTVPKPKKGASTKTLMQDRTVYKAYFKAVGTFHTTTFFAFAAFFAFTLKFPDLWVQWWSQASYGPGKRSLDYWIGIYALLETLPLIAVAGWSAHLMQRVIPNSARELHARLLDTTLHAPFPFMSKTDVGGILNRFNQDLMMIDLRLPLDMLNTSDGIFTSLMQIILITISVVYLLAILPPLFLVLYLLQNFYLRTSKQLRHIDLESKAALHTKFLETCSGLSTIRAFAWEGNIIDEFLDLLDRSQEPVYLLPAVQRWLQLVLNLIVAALTILVLGAAIGFERKVNPAAIGVAFLNATTLGTTLTNLIVSWTSLETSLGAIARITAFVRDTPQEQDPVAPETVAHDWPKEGGVEFRNVWASYAPATETEESIWCLRDINLRISPGEKVAVCGRTGSGKSSLILLLLAMLNPTSGSILIDGVDISHLPRSIVRKRLNAVPQDVFALAKSNREELDSRGLLTDKEIIAVLQKCGIWEKVQEVGGLDGISETEKLSAGEAQLFCLARAVVKSEYGGSGGGVVVIDEATSSVDEATERKIHDLTVEMLKEKTVVSVLHRLETAVKYDKILVLDEGKVLDFGTPDTVIERCELFSAFRTNEKEENGEIVEWPNLHS